MSKRRNDYDVMITCLLRYVFALLNTKYIDKGVKYW